MINCLNIFALLIVRTFRQLVQPSPLETTTSSGPSRNVNFRFFLQMARLILLESLLFKFEKYMMNCYKFFELWQSTQRNESFHSVFRTNYFIESKNEDYFEFCFFIFINLFYVRPERFGSTEDTTRSSCIFGLRSV